PPQNYINARAFRIVRQNTTDCRHQGEKPTQTADSSQFSPHPPPQTPPTIHPLHRQNTQNKCVERPLPPTTTTAHTTHTPPPHTTRPRFDPVRNHRVLRPMQLFNASNSQRRSPVALDLRAHLPQHHHQIRHFRLARRIFQHRLAVGQRRRHQNIFRPRHGNFF